MAIAPVLWSTDKMLVSDGKKSYFRNTIPCELSINGSFIQIFFNDNGNPLTLSVTTDSIQQLLEAGPKSRIKGSVNLDVPADAGTCLIDFLNQVQIKRIIEDGKK